VPWHSVLTICLLVLFQAVLQMLLHIGRSAPEGSTLSEEYAALQPHMIPFFCTFLASTKSEGQCPCSAKLYEILSFLFGYDF
jgi:hypothetical protein